MKILFGLHGTTHTEIAQSEIDAFRKSGAETATCTYGNWGARNGLFNSFKLVLKNAAELKRKAAEQNSDIIYLNTGLDLKTIIRDSITIFILRRFSKKIKIVLKIHGSQSALVFSKTNLLKKYIFKKADLFLVLSTEERKNFLSVGVPPNRVQVTANVIEESLYERDAEFKRKSGLKDQTNVLLFVGRFMKEKGILDLVECCRLLKENNFEFRLFCLGDGPLYGDVNGLIGTYGLKDNIKMLGHIPESETRYYYANCDMLVLPTYHEEGFPMAVFQAVGAGKPVITTRIRGAADHLAEFENCLWVEKLNPKQLSEKIMLLGNDKQLQVKMGSNNLLVAKKFTAEKIVSNLLEYFKGI